MNRSTPGLPVHHPLPSLLKLMSTESLMPSSHLILCRPLLLPPIPPSITVFYSESTLRMRWPKYSASVLPVNTLDWLWIKLLLNPYEGVWTLQHPSLPLGKYQGAMAELYVKSMFIFYKKLPVFFPSSYISFCILTKNRFLLLHILVSIWWCQCFRFWPL